MTRCGATISRSRPWLSFTLCPSRSTSTTSRQPDALIEVRNKTTVQFCVYLTTVGTTTTQSCPPTSPQNTRRCTDRLPVLSRISGSLLSWPIWTSMMSQMTSSRTWVRGSGAARVSCLRRTWRRQLPTLDKASSSQCRLETVHRPLLQLPATRVP